MSQDRPALVGCSTGNATQGPQASSGIGRAPVRVTAGQGWSPTACRPEFLRERPNHTVRGGVSDMMAAMEDFDALFRAEYLRLVRALSMSFSSTVAEEAVADAFAAAHRRWSRVSHLDDPAGWVRRVAINRAIGSTRSVLRRRRREELACTVNPTVALSDELMDLAAAIAALPQRQRLVFSLRYLADMGVADIAAALSISPGTVKSTLHDVRAKLTKETKHD